MSSESLQGRRVERRGSDNEPLIQEKLKSREEIFRRNTIRDESQRLEMMQETDFERAQLLIDNLPIGGNGGGGNTNSFDTGEGDYKDPRDELLEIFKGKKGYYLLSPEMEMYTAQTKNHEDQISRVEFVARQPLDSGVIRYSFRIYEPFVAYSSKAEHFEHVAIVDIDIPNNDVRTVVIPEPISREKPRKLLPPSEEGEVDELRSKLLRSLIQWIKIPEYVPKPTANTVVNPSGEYARETSIEIKDQVESVLMFRRRTIYPEDLENLGEDISSLLDSWNENEKKVLRDAGNGQIRVRLFSNSGDSDSPIYKELPEKPEIVDIQSIRQLIENELNVNGAKSVTIACVGSWIDRKYKNLEPGTSPKTHLRRMPGGIALVLNKGVVSPEVRALQQRIHDKKELTTEDLKILRGITGLNKAQLEEIANRGGITFKDGSFSPHPQEEDFKQVYFRKAA